MIKDLLYFLSLIAILTYGTLSEDSWHLTLQRQQESAQRKLDSVTALYKLKAESWDAEQKRIEKSKIHIQKLVDNKTSNQ